MTLCAQGRLPLFEDQRLRALVESVWSNLPRRFPSVAIDAFVVMPNHVHFIVNLLAPQAGASPAPTLGRVVGAFKSLVAFEWLKMMKQNRPNDSAAVWQRGFYERIIRSETELHRIQEYIANNPLNWQYDRENPARSPDAEYERVWSWIEQS